MFLRTYAMHYSCNICDRCDIFIISISLEISDYTRQSDLDMFPAIPAQTAIHLTDRDVLWTWSSISIYMISSVSLKDLSPEVSSHIYHIIYDHLTWRNSACIFALHQIWNIHIMQNDMLSEIGAYPYLYFIMDCMIAFSPRSNLLWEQLRIQSTNAIVSNSYRLI